MMRIRSVAYHEIVTGPTRYRYHVQALSLRQHLRLSRRLQSVSQHVDRVTITFDDGHESHASIALDELAAAGLQATFFVLAGPAGRGSQGLSWTGVRAIADAGHTIGSHGWSHRMLTRCTDRELDEELAASRAEIEDRIGRPVDRLSFPGGRWNDRVVTQAIASGYRHLSHSDPWSTPRCIGGVEMEGRWMVAQHQDARALEAVLCPSFLHWQWQRLGAKAKTLARSVIGEDGYHKLWCRLARFNPEQGMALALPVSPDQAPR